MRTSFLLLLLFSFLATAQAQYINPPSHQLNVYAGGTVSQIQPQYNGNAMGSVTPTNHLAPFFAVDFQQFWALNRSRHHRQGWIWSAGLAYTAFGANSDAYGKTNAVVPHSTSYITLPVMTGFQIQSVMGNTFALKGGFEFGVALDPYTPDATAPWGNVNAIVDLQFGIRRFLFGVRPQIGLTNYRTTPEATYRHLGVTVYVGASFFDTRYKDQIRSEMWRY